MRDKSPTSEKEIGLLSSLKSLLQLYRLNIHGQNRLLKLQTLGNLRIIIV